MSAAVNIILDDMEKKKKQQNGDNNNNNNEDENDKLRFLIAAALIPVALIAVLIIMLVEPTTPDHEAVVETVTNSGSIIEITTEDGVELEKHKGFDNLNIDKIRSGDVVGYTTSDNGVHKIIEWSSVGE